MKLLSSLVQFWIRIRLNQRHIKSQILIPRAITSDLADYEENKFMDTYYLAQIRNLPGYATVLQGNITHSPTIKALQTTEWTNLGLLPLPLCDFQQEVYTMPRRVKPVFH